MARLDEFDNENWIVQNDFSNLDNTSLYIYGFYWAVTTLTTVGYGDITAYSIKEYIICCMVMIIGVFLYSYTIGSLTNLLSNIDSRKAKLNKKLDILNNLARDFKFSKVFFKKLTNALEYEYSHNKEEYNEVINDLPIYLQTQLLVIIHKRMIEHNHFFENKDARFVA